MSLLEAHDLCRWHVRKLEAAPILCWQHQSCIMFFIGIKSGENLNLKEKKLEYLDGNENYSYDFSALLSLKMVFWRFKVYTVLYIFRRHK